jgi:hypothetical protein
LIERFEDARFVRIAAAALEQRIGFIAAIAPKVRVQKVNHRPKMPALFNVHLKQISQVVKRRSRVTELALLLNGGRFSVALSHNDAAQGIAKLAGHFLVNWLAIVVAEANLRVRLRRLKKNAPAILRHLHVIEMRPALAANVDRRAQPNVLLLETFRPHVLPPIEKVRQPFLQRALKTFVSGEIYVVRNALV